MDFNESMAMNRLAALLIIFLLSPIAFAKSALPSLLPGNWTHMATSKTKEGEAKPLEGVVIRWTFREDGTGTYYQKVSAIGQEQSKDFTWELDGKKVTLSDKTVYEIKKYGRTKMIWYNRRNDDYYHVERLDAPKLK